MDVIGKAKQAYDLAKQFENLELKEVVADLRDECVEMQGVMTEMKQEIMKKDLEISRLNEAFGIKGNIKKKYDRLWLLNDGKIDGPFCITCWEKHKILLSMIHNEELDILCPDCRIKMHGTKTPSSSDLDNAEK